MTTTTSTMISAHDGLQTYGLAGIELQRAAERRIAGPALAPVTTPAGAVRRSMRQRIGEAMIRFGTALSGTTARPITPQAEIA